MGLFDLFSAGRAPTIPAPAKALLKTYTKYEDIPADYVVIDTETGGLDPQTCEVLEIGAIKYHNGHEIARYHSFIRPVGAIPAQSSAIHGITWKHVCQAPLLDEMREGFFSFIGADVLVGHNIGFDIKFLQTRFGVQLSNPCFDTLEWSHIAFPFLRKYGLDYLRQHLGLGGTAHSALGDCEATGKLLSEICTSSFTIAHLNEITKETQAELRKAETEIDEMYLSYKFACEKD